MHIRGLAGLTLELPGQVLRSKDITIRGTGPGSWSMHQNTKEIPGLLEASKGMKKQSVRVVKLEDVEKAWDEKNGDRMVFVP
jgi:hypothetical protein